MNIANIPVLKGGNEAIKVDGLFASILFDAKAAVPALIELLSDSDRNVRARSTEVLGVMGANAEAALPGLTKALDGPDELVRTSARRAPEVIQLKIRTTE